MTELYHCLDQLIRERDGPSVGPERTQKKVSTRRPGKSYDPRFLCDISRANFEQPPPVNENDNLVPPFAKLVNPEWLAMRKNADFKPRTDDPNLPILQLDIKTVFKLDVVHDALTLKRDDIDYTKFDQDPEPIYLEAVNAAHQN